MYMYCQAANDRRNFEVFSVNFRIQQTDHDTISHETKVKPLSKFDEFLSTPTPSAAVVN